MKDKIIQNAVKNLHEFGYSYADKENIFTDEVYKLFFKNMLKDNLGNSDAIDKVLNELLKQID